MHPEGEYIYRTTVGIISGVEDQLVIGCEPEATDRHRLEIII